MSTKDERFKVLRSATRYILFHSISPSCIHHTFHSDTYNIESRVYPTGECCVEGSAFSRMRPCKLPIKLVARVVHDRRRRPVCRHGETRRRSRDVTILAHGRADYFISRWKWQTWDRTRRENKRGRWRHEGTTG